MSLQLRALSSQCASRQTRRATIDKLRQHNDAYKQELYLENKFSVTPNDNIAARRIASMQDEADMLTRKVNHQWAHVYTTAG
jgi:hypothetical protein